MSVSLVLIAIPVVAVVMLVTARATTTGVESARLYYNAENDIEAGDFKSAEAGFRQLARQQPDNPYPKYWLHCSLFQQGRMLESAAEYQDALFHGLPYVYATEPRCQEGKVYTAGFRIRDTGVLLHRVADPDEAFLADHPAPGSREPESTDATSVICWNAQLGLDALAQRQSELAGLQPPASLCDTP